ncbi:phosphoglycerate mutase [Mycolicibacterium sp. TY66]|uniref:histidine phosphatase family protein n=1 Tax=Mycobacteriaceae TaxID=1762 RepID=UPI001BB34C75|nr:MULTISPECIES: histidine phosphatase family protein [unclassified Mycolicibacterium]BCI79048.1 phosphoglycerate mutase [Mycolicibacterium sp. TY66]BCJ83291.1 phosphoglycerate mutase [Mycolicibacterium sp. TY81]
MSGRLVLVRHGQSEANVAKRLDTRPPGAALTQLGRQQARDFGIDWAHPVGLVVHSVAARAQQTAAEIADGLGLDPVEAHGIHEVQVGDLEDRSDAAAIEQFDAIYEDWQRGKLDVAMPGGETGREVLDRYVPVLTNLRVRSLDDHDWVGDIVVVSHGAAIRLVAAHLAGVDADFALEHHLLNAECVVLSPITDGRWSCVQWGAKTPPFYPGHDPEAPPAPDPMA